MTDSIFDIALEKCFTDSAEIATIDVTSADVLLIRDSATGAIMRLPFSTLASAISSAFSSSFASLVDGKVPASQLPSYVDDVLEYANTGAFPGTGETGKIYVAFDTNKTYRWSGSAYVEISASLALGETSSTAYRGDRGKTAYDHSQTTGNPHGTTKADVGLSNVDNTSDANKPVSTAQQTALNGKASISSGNWTPIIDAITTGPTPGGSAVYSGTYVKVGTLVFVDFVLNFNDAVNAVEIDDRFSIRGLPFPVVGAAVTGAGKGWQYGAIGAGNNAFWEVGCALLSGTSYLYFNCNHIDGTIAFDKLIRGQACYVTT